MPILSYAQNIINYTAIDIAAQYLKSARTFIQKHRPDLKVHTIKADLMNGKISPLNTRQKKAILFLGGTIGNFTTTQQNYIMKQIKNMTSEGDIFIFTVDSNENGASVLKAYNNEYMDRLTKHILHYLATLCSEFKQHLDEFKVEWQWEEGEKAVEIFFIAQKDITFYFPQFGQISIAKNQKLRAGRYKHNSIAEVFDLVVWNDFKILKILKNHNTINTFICERNDL